MPFSVHEMTPEKNRIGAGSPDRPFWGYRRHCPRPGAEEEREARVGWGEKRAVHGEMPVKNKIGAGSPDTPSPGYHHGIPPLLRGDPEEGPVWFLLTGRGFPPRPLPG